MKYAIYFTWNDGFEDTFISENAKDRDFNIKEMIRRGEFSHIEYCKIYANGEYGKHTIAFHKILLNKSVTA